MNGFGFIEYKDAMDARDVVPGTYPCSVATSSCRCLNRSYTSLSTMQTC
jgi:hypothetical protein